jgi:hypothetical protein
MADSWHEQVLGTFSEAQKKGALLKAARAVCVAAEAGVSVAAYNVAAVFAEMPAHNREVQGPQSFKASIPVDTTKAGRPTSALSLAPGHLYDLKFTDGVRYV